MRHPRSARSRSGCRPPAHRRPHERRGRSRPGTCCCRGSRGGQDPHRRRAPPRALPDCRRRCRAPLRSPSGRPRWKGMPCRRSRPSRPIPHARTPGRSTPGLRWRGLAHPPHPPHRAGCRIRQRERMPRHRPPRASRMRRARHSATTRSGATGSRRREVGATPGPADSRSRTHTLGRQERRAQRDRSTEDGELQG